MTSITRTRSILSKFPLFHRIKSLNTRNIYTTSHRLQTNTYDGDGKTKVQILNKELDLGLMINSYSQFGFRLNNELKIVGPLAIFPRSALAWNVCDINDINEDSLSLFWMLEPKIDVLVLGVGEVAVSPEFSKKILALMRKYKINVEILATEQACATFNFLNAEQRMVGAAIIPPKVLSHFNENDVASAKIRSKELYGVEF